MDASTQSEIALTPKEQALFDRLGPLFEEERIRMAKALFHGELLGQKEYELRGAVHELGAKALDCLQGYLRLKRR
jgi:hypothetical protein